MKGLRSASTTPRSARGTDPDDYEFVIGVSSVHLQEGVGFGDGNVTDLE